MKKRYIIDENPFGYFFHDGFNKADLSLKDVCDLLNEKEELLENNKFLTKDLENATTEIETLKEEIQSLSESLKDLANNNEKGNH